jgi:hypothetical protein
VDNLAGQALSEQLIAWAKPPARARIERGLPLRHPPFDDSRKALSGPASVPPLAWLHRPQGV